MRPRSKGMAYLAGTAATLLAVGAVYGISHLLIPLYGTLNMGYTGLLIRTGLYALFLPAAIYGMVHLMRKRDKTMPWWGVAIPIVIVSLLMVGTVRDLFAQPETRDFEVSFHRFRRPSGGLHSIAIVAKPLDGNGKSVQFRTTRLESIEGLPRYSRNNLPPGRYKMRITYYPHSRTRVSTELIEKIATPK